MVAVAGFASVRVRMTISRSESSKRDTTAPRRHGTPSACMWERREAMPRASNHIEPRGLVPVVRHYIRDLVYGANDGIITTFAVVAGVAGGALSHAAVLVIGAANLAADGVSMGVGNLMAIRAHERAREADNLPEEEASPMRHAVATFIAFVVAGSVPLAPYLVAGHN